MFFFVVDITSIDFFSSQGDHYGNVFVVIIVLINGISICIRD